MDGTEENARRLVQEGRIEEEFTCKKWIHTSSCFSWSKSTICSASRSLQRSACGWNPLWPISQIFQDSFSLFQIKNTFCHWEKMILAFFLLFIFFHKFECKIVWMLSSGVRLVNGSLHFRSVLSLPGYVLGSWAFSALSWMGSWNSPNVGEPDLVSCGLFTMHSAVAATWRGSDIVWSEITDF